MKTSQENIYCNYIEQVEQQANNLKEEIKEFILPLILIENIFDLVKLEFTKKLIDFHNRFYMQVPFELSDSILGFDVQFVTQKIWRELYDYPLEVVSPQII